MKASRDDVPKVLFLRSHTDDIVRGTKAWIESVGKVLACPGRTHLGRAWRQNPHPIDLEIAREPEGAKCGFFDLDVSLLRKDLYRILRPHLKGIQVGKVTLNAAGTKSKTNYVSIAIPPAIAIDPYRGKTCQHTKCRKCGEIRTSDMGTPVIAAASLAKRRLWPEEGGLLYIDDSLVQEIGLAKQFPDLCFLKVKVIPKPLDGDILPGDPGWDGTFRARRRKAP
ncbi:MAG: hypothetical protein NTV94_00925 [Planctomycetota bacterium]|nr:hypothetical protein [Planctomycetota bacterium]